MPAGVSGLYQSDRAAKLKADMGDWLSVSTSLDVTIGKLQEQFHVSSRPSDPQDSDFWLVLADQLHQYGLKHKQTFRLAQALIDTGVDLKLRESVAEEADLKARARLLQRLKKKWEAPARRIKKPPSLKPEPFLMRAGDVFSYETMNGNPNHFPAEAGGRRSRRFKPDAVNAFVCFATARVFFDKEARYFIIPLALFKPTGAVTVEHCVKARLLCHCNIEARQFAPLGGWMHWSADALKTVVPKKIGTIDPNPDPLVGVFGQTVRAPLSRYDGPDNPLWMNYGMHSPILRGHVWGDAETTLERFVKAWSAVEAPACGGGLPISSPSPSAG